MLPLLFNCFYFIVFTLQKCCFQAFSEPHSQSFFHWNFADTPKSAQNYEEKRKQANFFVEKCSSANQMVPIMRQTHQPASSYAIMTDDYG
jgi:hypothetical protein